MRFIFNEDQIVRLKQILSKENINEDFLDDLLGKGKEDVDGGAEKKNNIPGLDVDVEKKSQDVATKADFVGDNVDDFFKILEGIQKPIGEQEYGTMVHQQDVEAVQIGLQLLGYSLPKFGTDGLFGPETAAAVSRFKTDNNIKEDMNEAFVEIGDNTSSNLKVDSDTQNDNVNQELIDDLNAAAKNAGVTITITTASTGHSAKTTSGNDSRHGKGTAVDIAMINGVGSKDPNFKTYGDKLKDALVAMGYKWNTESGNDKAVLWQTSMGGNHYNHVHVSNNVGVVAGQVTKAGGEEITPHMVEVMVGKLRSKNITSDDIKKYIDPAVTSGGSADFTDLDLTTNEGKEAYKDICDNYISQRTSNSPVNGEMLANGAERAFKTYRKYIPPELALAQITLEGGLDSSRDSRPMRYKNPFNVSNTDNGQNKAFASFQDGVNAYYDLIARKYLVKGKTARDLVVAFTNDEGNSYATAGQYEAQLKGLIGSIRSKNAPVYAALAKKTADMQNLSEELLTEADKRQAIKNTLGFNDEWANEFHNLSDKLSIWIADTFVKSYMSTLSQTDINIGNKSPRQYVVDLFNSDDPHTSATWRSLYKPKYEYIMHWIRAPRREQINIRDLSLEAAYQQAEEWHDSLQYKKQSDYQENDEVFIDYRNAAGVGYYWVNLHRNYCSAEAERMGHCARANTPGSELISLRRINEFGEGESYLTVDYRPGGVIGDFHRHGNKKPTSRFHNQIVDFLINTRYPVTQLTSQGVHRYDDNFQLKDLSPENLQRVLRGNPNLRFNINDETTWPEIIGALIDGELNLSQYSTEIKLKLFKKSTTIGKGDEMKALFNHEMVLDMLDEYKRLPSTLKDFFMENFGTMVVEAMSAVILGNAGTDESKRLFINSLKEISQNFFDHYAIFCDFIDQGFGMFNEEEIVQILSERGIKRSIFSCTDKVPFLSRYASNSPIDRNGNIAVKTEDGLWGLLKQDGTTVLLPQFAGITPYMADRTGKTYMIKNLQGAFFIFNPQTGDYKRLTMK